MEEDWKGLDTKRLFRAVRRLAEQVEANGGWEASMWGIGRSRLDEPWAEVRAATAACQARTPRPIMRTVMPSGDRRPLDPRLAALASEVGASPYPRNLTVMELMAEFTGAEAEGIAIARRLLEVGFVRRSYPTLGTTHRYHCRGHDDRAELRRQLVGWLSDSGDA